MSEGTNRRGQVWEETYNASRSFLFLIIGEGTLSRMLEEDTPSYMLLDLETGNLDEIPQRIIEYWQGYGWRRFT